jgi:2,4-dienoyl-CoA reductase-like NADH-dependent reductase (Old Yellow Enzyme family)/thioredoxin reductase
MSFTHLFKPIQVGPVEIRNRIFSSGHQTTMVNDGLINDRLIAYHEARAKGGAGLLIAEIAAIHETAFFSSHTIQAYRDECIDGYRRLAETVHRYGAKIFAQLFHPGREVYGTLSDGRHAVSYAPSDVPAERYLSTPCPMSIDMIEELIQCYGVCAARIKAAGIDGVEIVASHGYLPAQFLNPRANLRQDKYGGDAAGRLLFLRECARSIRRHVGKDMVLGLRISGDEISQDGLKPDETLGAIRELDRDGLFDYVNIIAGSSYDIQGAVHIVPPMRIANAYVAPFAKSVKSAVSFRVLVGGRINQPQLAERILASGDADMCAMTRAMICDPDMPRKAAAAQVDDIRACIACNQACIGHMQMDAPISCIQFPESGRELEYGRRVPAAAAKSIVVVGGGPAGMKVAAVAAERGHRVTLYERNSRVGGQALLAQLLPGRAEFGGIVTNLSREIERAGVRIVTSCDVSAQLIHEVAPDVVVLATGSRPRDPSIEGRESAHVINAWQVLKGEANPGQSVVITDFRSDWIGVGIAEKLASEGRRVRYFTATPTVGQSLQSYLRDQWVAQLHALGVVTQTYARLVGVDSTTAYFQHTANGTYFEVDEVDTVVLSLGNQREASLAQELKDFAGDLRVIGDCLTPRTAEEAVFDGLQVGSEI